MTPRTRIEAISVDAAEEDVVRQIMASSHSRFPVYEENLDHVIGILHVKDLVRQKLQAEKDPLSLRSILKPAPAVPEDHQVEHLLAAFKRRRLHMAVVLDEFGGLAGIVTLEDLVEEVVGEVRDEFDEEREPLLELGPGVLEVDGAYLVFDLAELIYLGEPDELPEVDTVGGLIHTWLGRPPLVGDVVHSPANDQVRLTVLEVQGLAVTRVKVEYPIRPAGASEAR
jgi:CBS domain containing-hemolysin-like protein